MILMSADEIIVHSIGILTMIRFVLASSICLFKNLNIHWTYFLAIIKICIVIVHSLNITSQSGIMFDCIALMKTLLFSILFLSFCLFTYRSQRMVPNEKTFLSISYIFHSCFHNYLLAESKQFAKKKEEAKAN